MHFADGRAHATIGATSPSRTWYLAQGDTTEGTTTFILIQNPNPDPATVKVTYMVEEGEPIIKTHTVPGNGRYTIHANAPNEVGLGKSFSVKLVSDLPIVVERTMYFADGGAHATIGAPSPSNTWYLVEGYIHEKVENFIFIQNPNPTPAMLRVTYMVEGGGAITTNHVVPINKPYIIYVNDPGEAGNIANRTDFGYHLQKHKAILLPAGIFCGIAAFAIIAAKPEAGSLLLAFVLPFQQQEVNLGLFWFSVVDFVLWPSIAFWMLRTLGQGARNLRSRIPPTVSPLLLMGILFLPSFYNAISLSASLKEYARYFIAMLAYLFVYFHFSSEAKRREAIKTFLVVLVSGGVLSVLVLFWQYVQSGIFEFKGLALLNVYRFRQSSFFVDPNYYAEFLVTLLPISIGLCLTARGKPKFLLLASIPLFAIGVLLSFSRSGFLAMLISVVPLLIYLGIFRRSVVKPVLVGVIGALVLGFLLLQLDGVKSGVILLSELFGTRVISLGVNAKGVNAFDERIAILQSTANMIAHNLWFGVGLGNFERQFALYRIGDTGSSYRAAHNTFLRLWAETGGFTFIVYIVFLLLAIRYLLKALNKLCGDAAWKPIVAGLTAGWIGSLIMSLFLDQFVEVYYWIYLGVAMGAACQCERGRDSILR